eukprot:12958288-Heterocapsa_arctica.AAC.1
MSRARLRGGASVGLERKARVYQEWGTPAMSRRLSWKIPIDDADDTWIYGYAKDTQARQRDSKPGRPGIQYSVNDVHI